MAKKRKTLSQKILSDSHRKIAKVRNAPSVVRSVVSEIKIFKPANITKTNLIKYPYLIADVRKTSIVTAAIIAFQIFLFLILKFHVMKLPGISY